MVAMVAMISAGCGSGSGSGGGTPIGANNQDTGAGTSTGTGGGSSSGSNKNATKHERAVRFAECMRANGVNAFPDPDASGDLTLDGVVNGSSIDSDGAAWKQAISVCKALQPPGFAGTKATAKQMSARLKFAQCIRDNGVKDFPDPTKDGPMIDTRRIPSTAKEGGMDILHAAMQKCGGIVANQLTQS
jgi:hypothetical protein